MKPWWKFWCTHDWRTIDTLIRSRKNLLTGVEYPIGMRYVQECTHCKKIRKQEA